MNQRPLVSVIIPTYNRESLLKDAILSVLMQTYQNLELIIIDDCSKDNTSGVVVKFNDVRVKYVKHDKNKGFSATRNTGIKNASGDCVLILDDDDLMAPYALEKLVKKMNQSTIENLGAVYGASWWVDDKKRTIKIINSKENGNVFKEILKEQVFTNLLLKREVFEKVGLYDENLGGNGDFDFYLRLAKKYQFDFIGDIATVIRKYGQAYLSAFSKAYLAEHKVILEKYVNVSLTGKNFLARILPPKLYVKLSNLKNSIIYRLKLFFDSNIKKQIISLRKSFAENGVEI